MHHLFTSPIMKLVSKVWPQLLRRHFTKDRLEKFIEVDVSSSGERIQYYYQSQEGHCYLNFTNLSPFDFVIDRVVIVVSADGCSFTCVNLMPVELRAAAKVEVFARSMSPMLIAAAQQGKAGQRGRIEVEAYVTSAIWPFTIRKHMSDVTNVKIHV
jgi:hypothetical protein